MRHLQRALQATVAVCLLLAAAGCGVHYQSLPAGSVAGRQHLYDYSPSAIRSAIVLKIWWCGADFNPSDRTQFSDSI